MLDFPRSRFGVVTQREYSLTSFMYDNVLYHTLTMDLKAPWTAPLLDRVNALDVVARHIILQPH